MESTPLYRNRKVLALIDNKTNLGTVAKGRSYEFLRSQVCRKMFPVLLSNNITLLQHWVPFQLNINDTYFQKNENGQVSSPRATDNISS